MRYELVHWIGGKDVKSSRTLERHAPASGEIMSITCAASSGEVNLAAKAAKNALPAWAGLRVEDRAAYLTGMSDWLVREYGEAGKPTNLKTLISQEVGKPLPEADVEVIETADFLRYFATRAPEMLADQEPALDQNLWASKRSKIKFVPRGVVGIIKPWNYPLEMIGWSLAPALLAGNTTIIKPSEKSPVTASIFRKMATEVGLPPGVINIVYGDSQTGIALAECNEIDFITFTGSTKAGRDIAQRSASRLRPYSLEMGGNDAAVVLADADIETTANGLIWGAFANAGQVCVGVKRAYVAREIFAPLCEAIFNATKKLRLGVDIGPIVDSKQLSAIQQFVDDAVKKGAKVLVGGRAAVHKGGNYFQPTVLTEVPFSANILQEECFGPVLPLIPFDTVEAAIALANDSRYGLGASVWTSNPAIGSEVADKLQAGMVWLNDVNVAFPQTPWGGIKESGVGFELSDDVLREYVIRKHVSTETSSDRRRAWWYPY